MTSPTESINLLEMSPFIKIPERAIPPKNVTMPHAILSTPSGSPINTAHNLLQDPFTGDTDPGRMFERLEAFSKFALCEAELAILEQEWSDRVERLSRMRTEEAKNYAYEKANEACWAVTDKMAELRELKKPLGASSHKEPELTPTKPQKKTKRGKVSKLQ